MRDPSAAVLHRLFDYDPATGNFVRKVSIAPNGKAGRVAGCNHGNGYTKISVCGKQVYAHRLAWIYVNGEIPAGARIDHINGVRSDNRIANLRLCDDSQNSQNIRAAKSNNACGFLGVYKVQATGKYMAQVKHAGRLIRFGGFETPEEAHAAYVLEKRKRHDFCTI